jgi:hypothetical protein
LVGVTQELNKKIIKPRSSVTWNPQSPEYLFGEITHSSTGDLILSSLGFLF